MLFLYINFHSSKPYPLFAKGLQSFNAIFCVEILRVGKLLGLNGIIYANLKWREG